MREHVAGGRDHTRIVFRIVDAVAADRDDALAFYRRFYSPNNAIVVVAGDVTAEEVKADAEATYGQVPVRADMAPRRRPQEPLQEAPRTVTLADPQVEQPSINRYYLAPSRTTAKPGESEALEVLALVGVERFQQHLLHRFDGWQGPGERLLPCRRDTHEPDAPIHT